MNINLANIDFCPGGKSATLTETTAEILLTETEKVILPPEGTDGFNKVTITHAPVEESVSATITENGTHTITPSEGFGAMFGVNVNVNVSGGGDASKYSYKVPTADDTGLKTLGWTDDDVNYYKYNNYAYSTDTYAYKVSDANKQIVINNKSDIATYASNPDFQYCPKFDTSNVTSMGSMFNMCTHIKSIPQLDTSNVTNMNSMFFKCSFLTSIPPLDTSNVTNMESMFNYCSSLTSIPQLDTSNVTNMNSMFYECSSLASIPKLNTSNVTDMGNMFFDCLKLINIPQLDTSKVTFMANMFNYCRKLVTIPQLDTSNVKNMYNMFYLCDSLTSIPPLDTSNVTNMENMFYRCIKLNYVPLLDITHISTTYQMFYKCNELTSIGGLRNLKLNLDLSDCPKLTKESLLNVFNEAADVTADPSTLTLGPTNLAKLTDADKAIATNKGWILA